jgi:2-dehydro-3-deoxyphosphogalactonate aldolase
MSFISNLTDFKRAYELMPLFAILRGVRPEEVEATAKAVIEEGIGIVEIPLNSPEPFESIGRIAKMFSGRAIVGAGTVLTSQELERVAAAGGQLAISPNFNPGVVEKSKSLGLVSAPGVMTPSEAFAALARGADVLKLFPGEVLSLPVIKAYGAVLPKQAPLVLVGGVNLEAIAAFANSPVSGFGIGSSLYKPGMDASEVRERSRAFVKAMRAHGFGQD